MHENNTLALEYAARFSLLLDAHHQRVESKAQLAMLFDFYSSGVLESTSPISKEIMKLDFVIDTARTIILNQTGLI